MSQPPLAPPAMRPHPPATSSSFSHVPDRPGIVHAASGFLLGHGGNILESQHFRDPLSGRFFMRIVFETPGTNDVDALRADFAPVAAEFDMEFELWEARAPYRTLILVSKHLHCLNDLLFRTSTGSLQIDVAAVVSNHTDAEAWCRRTASRSTTCRSRRTARPRRRPSCCAWSRRTDVDLVVLARYMQVLSDSLCRAAVRQGDQHPPLVPAELQGGAPYHQAFDRGVKLVGATAHYVTRDLDEGPIIEQDVLRVDHSYDQDHLVSAGRDVEAQVLSRAVRWHSQSRVLLNGHRTVVFR